MYKRMDFSRFKISSVFSPYRSEKGNDLFEVPRIQQWLLIFIIAVCIYIAAIPFYFSPELGKLLLFVELALWIVLINAVKAVAYNMYLRAYKHWKESKARHSIEDGE